MTSLATRSVSVSIVSYNTRNATLACVASVLGSQGLIAVDVTVVDNASSDGSADAIAQRFPDVKLIRNNTNRFFSGAHNQALKEATGTFALILNSDTEVGPTIISQMVEFLDAHPEVGAATCLYLDQNHRPMRAHLHNYWQFRSLWRNALGRHSFGLRLYRLIGGAVETTDDPSDGRPFLYVDVASDTFLLARREVLAEIGFYDEEMLLYATEDDICMRIVRAGWRVAVNRKPFIIHHLSGSVRQMPPLSMRRIFRNDCVRYYEKHGNWLERLVATPVLYLAYLIEAGTLMLGYRMRFRG